MPTDVNQNILFIYSSQWKLIFTYLNGAVLSPKYLWTRKKKLLSLLCPLPESTLVIKS